MPEGSRRKFLGAAAALGTLSWPDDPGGSTGENTTPAGDSGGDSAASDYGPRKVTSSVGGVDLFVPYDRNRTTEVKVTSHPEGVTLALEHDAARMSVMLLPEDVDDLRAELAAAADRLRDEDVDDTREWIGEYRE